MRYNYMPDIIDAFSWNYNYVPAIGVPVIDAFC